MLHLLGSEHLHKLFGILPRERFVSFCLIYLFIHFKAFVYVSMDSWVFILYFGLSSNTAVFLLLLKWFQLWPLGALLFLSCVSFSHSHHCIWTLPYFLTQPDACTFPVPVLAADILLRILGSFYWRMVWETKIQVVGVLVSAGMLLLLSPFSWESKETYI